MADEKPLAPDAGEWRVTSALFTDQHHAGLVWDITTSGVDSDYDSESDVLYLSKGAPQAAVTESSPEGLLLRYTVDGHVPCGVTVLSYRQGWHGYHELLVQRVSDFLGVAKIATERAVQEVVS